MLSRLTAYGYLFHVCKATRFTGLQKALSLKSVMILPGHLISFCSFMILSIKMYDAFYAYVYKFRFCVMYNKFGF